MAEEYYLDRIRDGGTLSGEVSLLLHPDGADQTSGANSYAASISLLVDGQALEAFHQLDSLGEAHHVSGRAIPLEIYLPTYHFPNGEHTVAAARPLGEAIVARQVVFQNVISRVSYTPIFDLTPGAEDIEDKSHITATVSPSQPWEVRITNMEDEVVKSLSGLGNEIDIFWDGTDANGVVVEDNSYTLDIIATDSNVTISPGCIIKSSL